MQIYFMEKTLKIRQVSAEKILPLRRDILRPGYSLQESRFEGDLDANTFHLALFEENKIQAVATFMQNKNPLLPDSKQYQLRGMAVNHNLQGKGFGKAIFEKGEKLLRLKNIGYLWFNARKTAVDFYRKQGCRILGEEFDIPSVGPHFVMIKKLN